MRARRRTATLLLAAIMALFLTALLPQISGAVTTHRFIKKIDLPVNGAQLMGVDPQGNVILFAEGAIRKFNSNGEPVNFSALGTNVIDGAGGGDCPATPADCDQTPFNVLGEPPNENFRPVLADMHQSQFGPTAGYMYVAAVKEVDGQLRAQIVVFDPTGRYIGQIDTTQVTPTTSGPEAVPNYVSVAPGGTIVVNYHPGGFADSDHSDKYQPVNGDPADDAFVGQLRGKGFVGAFQWGVVADDDFVYGGEGGGSFQAVPLWRLFDAAAFGQQEGRSVPVNFDPGQCENCDASGPFGDGGRNEEPGGYQYQFVSVNPADHHAFLLDSTGWMEEWSTPTERTSPPIQDPNLVGSTGQMAFDTSNIASTKGRIYLSRGSSLSVFSPPVPLAEIENLQATVGHDDAEITATIDLAHGPKVSTCRVEWGEEFPGQQISFPQSSPCEPAAPYEDEVTQISMHIPNLQPEVTYQARVVVKTNNGTNRSAGVKFRPAAVLSVQTDPADEVTRTTARLRGSLDPDGMPTTYWFEYGIDTNYLGETAKASAGEGTGVISVAPVVIDNLQPGRRYHFRLVASNELGTTYGPDQSFLAASVPTISGVRPSEVTETGAVLNALVNPGGYPTTYQFEYGTTSSYGSTAPVDAQPIGDGDTPVPVSVKLAGLQPGSEYHFRIVATNAWGAERSVDSTFTFFPPNCPNAYVRQLTRAAYLPDCRAYEIVSPRDSGGIQLYPGELTVDLVFYNFTQLSYFKTYAQNLGTASNPGRFSFLGLSGALPGTNPPNSILDTYTSTRTANGWVSRYWGLQGDESIGAGGAECDLEMAVCIDYRVPELLLQTDPNFKGSHAPYVWDFEGNSLGRWPTNLGVVKGGEDYVGDDLPSPDFSHYVFSSNNVRFTPDGVLNAPGSAYDNDVEEATVKVISRLPGGADIPAGGGAENEEEFIKIPAVSTDGSHILMTTQGPSGVRLYMSVNDAVTYEIAKGMESVRLLGMTKDGSQVVFASRDHVTADDTDGPFNDDIFVWKEKAGEVVRVSQGNGAGNSDDCQPAEGIGCPASPVVPERLDSDDRIASQSGDVYFYSPEQLDPENPGLLNEKNLYVYRHGAVQYVATLDAGTAVNRLQISPDGEHAAFLTESRLTGYDNQGWREMYTYDAGTGVIKCASCLPSGEPPQIFRQPEEGGAAQFPVAPERLEQSKDVLASQSGRFMSDDGRVAFATSDALVESDTNGLLDVYEYVGGRPQLITSGTGNVELLTGNRFYPGEFTGLEAISHDGIDIFFSTYETLAPDEDANGQFLKFYDARTNGGFVPPPTRLPCVAADECHGDENAGPAPAQIGTGARLGDGPRQAVHKKKKKKKKKHKKARHKRHGRDGKERRHG